MTLDEAIKHYEELAEKEERSAKLHPRPDKDVKGSGKKYLSCLERAEEHRQLAEWLMELKRLREQIEPEKCGDCISREYIESIVEELENICINSNEHILSLLSNIKNAPSIMPQPERCEDCISRRAIIGKCEDTAKATSDIGEMNTGFIMALDFIADYAKHMSSVEPERKTGHWHLLDECANEGWYCDQCNKKVFRADFSNTMKKYKFCPNCGSYNGG